jgi:hypothetical protein
MKLSPDDFRQRWIPLVIVTVRGRMLVAARTRNRGSLRDELVALICDVCPEPAPGELTLRDRAMLLMPTRPLEARMSEPVGAYVGAVVSGAPAEELVQRTNEPELMKRFLRFAPVRDREDFRNMILVTEVTTN